MKKTIGHSKNKKSFSFYPKPSTLAEVNIKKIFSSASSATIAALNTSSTNFNKKKISKIKPTYIKSVTNANNSHNSNNNTNNTFSNVFITHTSPKKQFNTIIHKHTKHQPPTTTTTTSNPIGKSSSVQSIPCQYNDTIITSNTNTIGNSFTHQDKARMQEELLELQLQNSRLQNEICILTEKTNSLTQIISMKDADNDLLKTKLNDYLCEFKSEISHLNKLNIEYKKYKTQYETIIPAFKSFIQVLSELIEIFIQYKRETHITHRSTISNKNDNSIDIYDSFSNIADEDKRTSIINQIQTIFISKLKHLDKLFTLNLEKEIDKIQSWNFNTNNNNNSINNINTLSNISNILKFNNNNEISNSNSNEFEFSVSKTFFQQSPRFTPFTNSKKDSNNISYRSFCNHMINNSDNNNIINAFIPKSKSNNTSIMKNVNINITSNYNSNNTVRTQDKNYVNILDCSFGDFVKHGGKDESFGDN